MSQPETLSDFVDPDRLRRDAVDLAKAGKAREADALLKAAIVRFPDERGLLWDAVLSAETQRDWAEAWRRAELLRQRFDFNKETLIRAARYLAELGRLEEAERLLLDGQSKYPSFSPVFIDYGRLAERRMDWAEALARLEVAAARFPDTLEVFVRIAKYLRELQRLEESEKVIAEGLMRFPYDLSLCTERAKLAEMRRNHDGALHLYSEMIEKFPGALEGYIGTARLYRNKRMFKHAENLLIDALRRFPRDAAPLIDLAQTIPNIKSFEREMSAEALTLMIDDYLTHFDPLPYLLIARANMLRLSGDLEGYRDQTVRAARQFPDHAAVRAARVIAAEVALGNTASADELIVDKASLASLSFSSALVNALEDLQSLGGGRREHTSSYGCEFGFIQRHFGVEQLALLRWCSIQASDVTRCLQDNLEGIGALETTAVRAIGGNDWGMVDTKYGIYCDHTHLDRATIAETTAKEMLCKRNRFLAHKLRGDLSDGERLFVYRDADLEPDEEQPFALAAAANKFGRNTVLYVRRYDHQNPPFSIRQAGPGLFIGYLDWFAVDRGNKEWNYNGWTQLVLKAHDLWKSNERFLRPTVE